MCVCGSLTGSICVCVDQKNWQVLYVCVCIWQVEFDRFYMCVWIRKIGRFYMCLYVFDRFYMCVWIRKIGRFYVCACIWQLVWIVVELDKKKKKKRFLERNDEGQGKIFDMFFGIDVEFDPKKKKKKWFAGKKLYKWLWCFKIPTNVQLYMPGMCNYWEL